MNIIERQVFENTKKIKAKSLAKVIDNLGENVVLEIVNNYMHRQEYKRALDELWEDMRKVLKEY